MSGQAAAEREAGTGALKRRGLIAGAAALVAGMVAKQTSQPVAAAPVTADYFDATGTATFGYDTFSGTFFGGVYAKGSSYGLYGTSTNGYGVFGNTNAPTGSGKAAVYGNGNGDGSFGVFGLNSGSGVGMHGQSDEAGGTGVKGVSINGFPVIGVAIAATNPAPGLLGLGTAGPGVQGQSGAGHGLIGYTGASDGHAGLVGYGIYAGSVGLIGIAPGYGTGTVGNAGVFYGNVHIQGAFDAPVMRTVVPHHGDGSHRLLQTMTSPEGWIEDFGEATLTNSSAHVSLDPDFAALIETASYQVYLTEYGDHNDLYVATQSGSGFEVRAKEKVTAGGMKAPTKGVNGRFGYRVVGKRRDMKGARLATVAAPAAPPRPAAFTIPETPVVASPAKEPPPARP